ncbi:MAG: type II toxin-antitoxin system RelE/ParE family toxin [Betaproteobacteria bacterium]
MSYRVELTRHAVEDLERLATFTLERELACIDGDLDAHRCARVAIEKAVRLLEWAPFTCRMAADNPFIRELVIPFGSTGYVALFEVMAQGRVVIAAFRHQREGDYPG